MRSSRRLRTIALSILLGLPLLVVTATGAAAQVTEPGGDDDAIVVITGGVEIAPGQVVGDVVVVNGAVTVGGTATGDVFVLNGATTITGEVTGDVVVVNGAVTVGPGARIGGDLVTGSAAVVAADATIAGERRRVDFGFVFGRAAIIGAIVAWIAVAVSTLVLGMLFLALAPRAAAAIATTATTKVGPTIGWGFATFFGIPIAAGLAIATLVGIPLGVAVLLALALLYAFGGVSAAFAVGRALVKPPSSRFVAFIAGWAILAGASLVPVLGGLAWFAAMVYGLGAITVSVWNARREQAPPVTVTPQPAPAASAAIPLPPPTP